MNNESKSQELENGHEKLKKQKEYLRLHNSFLNEVEKRELEFSIIKENKEESEKYTHTILNHMGDPVFVKDDQSKLILVNNAFCQLFDLTRAEIIGKTLAEDVAPSEREKFLKIDKQVLLDGIENINEETLTVRGGETLLISTRKSRFVDSAGKKFIIGVIRDITESKKTEAALKESEARFRALNTTKDQLFAIISHDLRSPINNIIALSELLHKTIEDLKDANAEKYLDLINSTSKNTLNLLGNLLDWTKSQTGQIDYQSVNINITAIIDEILEQSDPIAKTKNITLSHIASDEIEVSSDKKILKTILRNLISNAIKFTQSGGKINVFVISKDNQVIITISDNGVGMNEKTRQKLFATSSNLSTPGTSKEQGAGFGLILCKEFVEKLGGSIWVKSEEGKGSDFNFTLPLNKST